MAYAPKFRHDVFISYSYHDNEPGLSGVRWVTQFTKYLTTSLRQRLGCRDELDIFFGNRDLASNDDLQHLVDHVQHSATFVAVISPSYVSGDWTLRELQAFVETVGFEDRLFVVEMLPLEDTIDYPEVIARKPRDAFWHIDEMNSHVPLTFDPQFDSEIFARKVLNLSGQVRNRLHRVKTYKTSQQNQPAIGGDLTPAAASSLAESEEKVGTILLAQTTDELEAERQQVRSFLEQMGVNVLPKYDYPQGGEDFQSHFTEDLSNSDLFVQLLGATPGRRPRELPEGYPVCQFRIADESSKPLLLWRHPQLDIENIPKGGFRELVLSPHTVAAGLESFKTDILTALAQAKKSQRQRPMSLVYIGADQADLPIAKQLQKILGDKDFSVVIPTFEGSSEEKRQDLEENFLDSDTLILIHGLAPATWLRSNLRRLHKTLAIREDPPSKVAVFLAPPPEKSDVGIMFPYLEFIDSRDKLNTEALFAMLRS